MQPLFRTGEAGEIDSEDRLANPILRGKTGNPRLVVT